MGQIRGEVIFYYDALAGAGIGDPVSYLAIGEELHRFARVQGVNVAGFDGAPKSWGTVFLLGDTSAVQRSQCERLTEAWWRQLAEMTDRELEREGYCR